MRMPKRTASVLLCVLGGTTVAEDFFEPTDAEPTRTDKKVNRSVEFAGDLTHRYHYALTDQKDQLPFRRSDTGAASIRYDLYLEAQYRAENNVTLQLAGLASHDDKLDDGSEFYIDESYVEWGVTPAFNIKAGRQAVSLGESNYFQIADRINPTDERAFGLAELSETLLPIASTRLSYYQSRWGLDLVALHEFRPNLYDEPYGDFDPYIEFRHPSLSIRENSPDVSLFEPDIAGRIFWSQPWGDMALFASRLHSRQARPVNADADSFTLGYSQSRLFGASANRVLGSWLLKSEYAYSDGDLFLTESSGTTQTPGSDDLSVEGWSHTAMVGGRYSGIRNLTLDFELMGSRIGSDNGPLGEEDTVVNGVANLEYEMLNDDLVANLTYMTWLENPASVFRVRLDYAFRDEIVLFAGAINYSASSEEAMLYPYENNDRMFFGFTIDF